jgi:hypothetical protein
MSGDCLCPSVGPRARIRSARPTCRQIWRPRFDPPRRENPIKDSVNLRRHRNACPLYRESWSDLGDDILYRCYCLLDTPPTTADEQDLCLRNRRTCWRPENRLAFAARLAEETRGRDRPATSAAAS